MEEIILEIILHSGNAKTKCLQAFQAISNNQFEQANALLKEAKKAINVAHKAQTVLIQKEANNESQTVTLLLAHAQDHLMTTLAIKDMVFEMLEYGEKIDARLQQIEQRLEKVGK